MLDLLDYRRRVFDLYRRIRDAGSDSPQAFKEFCATRDDLFTNHPQSALTETRKATFTGLRTHAYDPACRVLAELDRDVEPLDYALDGGDDGDVIVRQIGQVRVALPGGVGTLGVFWITGYGGGLFLPFRDATNDVTTYGGGRYLLDTIKGADLGMVGEALVLDFNYAYHPSCYYNPRWVCPLAPMQNRLAFPVEAGEQLLD